MGQSKVWNDTVDKARNRKGSGKHIVHLSLTILEFKALHRHFSISVDTVVLPDTLIHKVMMEAVQRGIACNRHPKNLKPCPKCRGVNT